MSLALPLHADTANLASEASSANSPSDTADSAYRTVSASSGEALGFTLQHRFNGGEPVPTETIKISPAQFIENPLQAILKALKQNFSKHLEKQTKPMQIDTELEFLFSKECFGQLPTVSIKTNINKDGVGKSEVVFPAYRHEVSEKCGKGLIDWKGLDGQFSFTDQFENLTMALNFAGSVQQDEFAVSFGKETTLSGTFDADLMLTQMNWNFPSCQIRENDFQFNWQAVTINANLEKTPKGFEFYNNMDFKVGHVDWSEVGLKISLDGWAGKMVSELQNGVLNYTSPMKIDKLVISGTEPKEALVLSHVGELAFRRFDEEALLALQTMEEQLPEQEYKMLSIIMSDQFMAVAPKLVAKSPEIALNRLTVTTPKGNLQGNLNIRLDSKKVTELAKPALIKALQAKINFTIGKELQEQDVTGLQVNFIKAWLVDAGDGNYKFNAELKDSKLTVNGLPISLPIGSHH
ncbi:MAG: hypothetical protein DRR08_20765 [Candidatus Parabeggiatoa sp. nov. 2]|nr:MAG: hypothetical protein B6247_14605 [Beggiatoa sp. 4572_84]RKZ56780.1 MAG: hypothetical protein DRR08_20765 [Gammaproteobacteria bacterium]HEC84893.1 DUF945 family protein [Thioploca sp.]